MALMSPNISASVPNFLLDSGHWWHCEFQREPVADQHWDFDVAIPVAMAMGIPSSWEWLKSRPFFGFFIGDGPIIKSR